MDMCDFDMLAEYWSFHPPVHLMVAGYLGIKPKKPSRDVDADDLAQWLASAPGWSKQVH